MSIYDTDIFIWNELRPPPEMIFTHPDTPVAPGVFLKIFSLELRRWLICRMRTAVYWTASDMTFIYPAITGSLPVAAKLIFSTIQY